MMGFAAFFISFILVFIGNASLHSEMGAPHILDPDGILMDEAGLPRSVLQSQYKPFSPSEDYKELQTLLNEIRTELGKNPNPKRRSFLEKMLFTTQEGLMHLYLRDKNIHAGANKKVERYASPGSKKKSTEPFNRVADKSGAILWAHRQGILGQGVEVWVLEDWGTLEKEGLPTPRLASVIKSTQLPLQRGPRDYDVREKGLAHGAEVTGVVYQIAPKADIHLIGDSVFSAVFHSTHPHRGQADNPFPEKDVILNESSAKGTAGASIGYQIGHMQGFFEARSRYGDLLVRAIPNREGGGPGQTRDRKQMIKYATGPYPLLSETDPVFAEHILKHYGAHIILAGSMGKYGTALRPFLVEDTLQNLAQERFLIAWGEDVLTPFIEGSNIDVKSGTSIAAPTISGAAALIKSKYPHLTCAGVGEILLESAERTFWDGFRNPTFVYDPEDFEEESPEELGAAFAELFGEAFVPKSEKIRLSSKIKAEPFSSALYGRGILNLRRAFIYAETKDKHPGFTAEQLKPLFKAAVRAQEDKAARTIQRAFRAYRV